MFVHTLNFKLTLQTSSSMFSHVEILLSTLAWVQLYVLKITTLKGGLCHFA